MGTLVPLGAGAALEGCQCWLRPPARWGGAGAALEGVGGLGRAGPQGNSRMGRMVLARFMDSDRNGAYQYQAIQVEGE